MSEYRAALEQLAGAGIRSRTVAGVNGLTVQLLEAGPATERRPLVLLLHGFPELCYSWRKVMLPLAEAGYCVVAPDQRGYGATTGWDPAFDGDLASFRMLNLVRDAIGVVAALGYERVHAVIGHDAGAGVAAWCSLIRPDIFQSVVMMSAPFGGPPALQPAPHARPSMAELHDQLAALDPPRKHYQWYYSSRHANADMQHCAQGLHGFLRAYYHYKSADWPGNQPYRLHGWTAAELAKLPTYYVMNLHDSMPEAVAAHTPSAAAVAACRWLPDGELAVYRAAYAATGFQGGLQWYRCGTGGVGVPQLQLFAGRTIDVPSCFISGAHDWGVYQSPGAYERMQEEVCTRMLGCHLLPGAGHWVQQEQPERVTELVLEFFRAAGSDPAAPAADHERFMRLALEEARRAAAEGNEAVGSVIVKAGKLVARGRNLVPATHDPTAHAEIVALRAAVPVLGTEEMTGCTLYTTFEPCPMCCGALLNAGISTLVMGARAASEQTRWGGYSLERLLEMTAWGDRMAVVTGVLVDECRSIHQP